MYNLLCWFCDHSVLLVHWNKAKNQTKHLNFGFHWSTQTLHTFLYSSYNDVLHLCVQLVYCRTMHTLPHTACSACSTPWVPLVYWNTAHPPTHTVQYVFKTLSSTGLLNHRIPSYTKRAVRFANLHLHWSIKTYHTPLDTAHSAFSKPWVSTGLLKHCTPSHTQREVRLANFEFHWSIET